MSQIKIPEWLASPREIKIRCAQIMELKDSKELIVQIKINGEELTAFIPKELIGILVDIPNKTIQALEVAKFNEDILVDLPVETLTSGPRILIPKNLIKEVVVDEAA